MHENVSANCEIPAAEREGYPLSMRLRDVSMGGREVEPDEYMDEPGPYYVGFLNGGLSKDQVARQIFFHWCIYQELESAARAHAERDANFPFRFSELDRTAALERDMEYWAGENWRNIPVSPAVSNYVQRIREVAFDSVPMFVAHQYTRYLGDLSGGQYIGKRFASSYQLEDRGAEFYHFEGIKPREFKQHYRQVLDSYPFTPEDKWTIEEEVARAYRLNNLAFMELEEGLSQA